MQQNIGTFDRIFRMMIAGVLAIVSWYWLAEAWNIVGYVVAIIVAVTALIRWCPVYIPMNLSTVHKKEPSKVIVISVAVAVMLLLVAGAYASETFSKKLFIEDFNAVNAPYKQALFQTGQDNRTAAIDNYDAFVVAMNSFEKKYSSYRPPAIKSDGLFDSDLASIKTIITSNKELVYSGNLTQAHLELEKVRPIFNEMLRRNDLSLLSVSLVDFHDSMEVVLDAANAKDAQKVILVYVEADSRLKAVEAELNDEGVQNIRKQLDLVRDFAVQGDVSALPAQASVLKSSYVNTQVQPIFKSGNYVLTAL